MIKRIGCFHFVQNYANPFGALRDALGEHGDVSDSLIVLPEAFNNGKPYYDQPRGQPVFGAKHALNELREIAAKERLILVVGLLAWPSSSAYLIDGAGARLICRKKSDDGSNNYEASQAGLVGECNPIAYDGADIGALMCNEIDHYGAGLSARLDECTSARRIICIPAWMSATYFGSDRLMTDHWEGKYVALANSNPYGCGSFIANTRRYCHRVVGETNQVVFKTWDELDSYRSD